MSVFMALRVILFSLLLSTSAVLWAIPMILIGAFLPYRLRFKLVLRCWCRLAVWLARTVDGINHRGTGLGNTPDQSGVILDNDESTWATFLRQLVCRPDTQQTKKERGDDPAL